MGKDLNEEIGKRLKECRLENNLNQSELGDAAGCTYVHISNIENGHKKLTFDMAKRLADAMGVRAEYLLCKDNIKTNSEYYKFLFEANTKANEIGVYLSFIGYWQEFIKQDTNELEKVIIVDESKKENSFICSCEDYLDMSEEIEAYIKMKLLRLRKKGNPATSEQIEQALALRENELLDLDDEGL